jgi:integrase
MLTGIRFKYDEGTYDPRDYEASNPLGLENQIEKYLSVKEATLKPGSLKSTRPHVRRIQNHFGPTNVKAIGYAEVEDFLLQQTDIGDKTRHCVCSVLHDFFSWLVKRKVIRREQSPEFPSVKFKLGFRKIVTKDVQSQILEELRRITANIPRIHIGALWLCTYINLRPSELLGILEEHIDYDRGIIHIVSHKTEKVDSKPKFIPLLSEDLAAIKALPRGFPKMHFFRHDKAIGGQSAGTPFGKDLIYKKWIHACRNLGIKGIDLYGGTRHSSSSALRQFKSFEDTKRLLGDETNAAAVRYIQQDIEALRTGYALTRTWTTNGPPGIDRKPIR